MEFANEAGARDANSGAGIIKRSLVTGDPGSVPARCAGAASNWPFASAQTPTPSLFRTVDQHFDARLTLGLPKALGGTNLVEFDAGVRLAGC